MKKGFLILLMVVSVMAMALALEIPDSHHVNFQVLDSGGSIQASKSFNFIFNITNSTDCSGGLYSNITTLSTDKNGIISYYLEDINITNYNQALSLCRYRDGVLIDNSSLVPIPQSKFAENTTTSGLIADSNISIGNFDVIANKFYGLLDIALDPIASIYFAFNGTTLTLDQEALNGTIDNRINITVDANNESWTNTFNSTYDEFAYNQTTASSTVSASNVLNDSNLTLTGFDVIANIFYGILEGSANIGDLSISDFGSAIIFVTSDDVSFQTPLFNVEGDVNVEEDLSVDKNAIIDGNFSAQAINGTDWTNVSITESQISDLTHTTDTNDTDLAISINQTANIESLGSITSQTANNTYIIATNESILNTNSSKFWTTNEGDLDNISDIYPTTDTRYLNLSGTNANQNVNIGNFNFTAFTGFFTDLVISNVFSATNLLVPDNGCLNLGNGTQGIGDVQFCHNSTDLITKVGGGPGKFFNKWFINRDTKFTEEVDGVPSFLSFSELTGGTVNSAITLFPKAGEVPIGSGKGFDMLGSGSVTGISFNYDISASSGLNIATVNVRKNGAVIWSNALVVTTGTDKSHQSTQARGTDTFVAGDTIDIQFKEGGLGKSYAIDEIVGAWEFYYD